MNLVNSQILLGKTRRSLRMRTWNINDAQGGQRCIDHTILIVGQPEQTWRRAHCTLDGRLVIMESGK